MTALAILGLVGVAAVLAWPAPRLMADATWFRRAPRAALVVWQSVSLAAVLAALAAAPVAAVTLDRGNRATALLAAVVSGVILARLLVQGHVVGTRLRALRRVHRQIVDLVGDPRPMESASEPVRVLAHPTPTAYCLPGVRRRVVLSQGILDALPPRELAAVIAHERAHLRARHDLVLEFFTVLHEAVPRPLRSEKALDEVRLLVEVLADRAAERAVGAVPLARALATLARGEAPPVAAIGAGTTGASTRSRLGLLAEGDPPRGLSSGMYGFAASVLMTPVALTVWALVQG